MNKRFLSLLCLLIYFANCKSNSPSDEFEGIITYKLGYENFKLKAYYGDTLKVYYSHGNVLSVYNPKISEGLRKCFYIADEHKQYLEYGSTDTLRVFNVEDDQSTKLLSIKETTSNQTYLGYKCKRIDLVLLRKIGNDTLRDHQTFIYSPQVLKINKNKFEDFNFMSLNKIMSIAGTYYLYFESNVEYLGKMKYEIVKIENKKLDPAIFKINSSKTKDYPY